MKTNYLPAPNHAAIRRTEHVLTRSEIQIEDLIAVFTNSEGSGGLLVYNAEYTPPVPSNLEQDGWCASVIATLMPDEYARYDGPVITLAAIDVLLDDIPTHGVYFYPLDDLNLFRLPKNQDIFRRTACRLAQAAGYRWQQLPAEEQEQRWPAYGKRIVQLCLPMALATYQDPDLVALRFDLSDLSKLSMAISSAQPVFNRHGHPNDVQSLEKVGDHEWVAGFKEIPLLIPDLIRHLPRLLLFRPALRQFGARDRVPKTCRGLAQRCWTAWEASKKIELLQAAYALAAEAWLEDQDATDLVAILPDEDFEQFILHGRALAVNRGPVSDVLYKENRCSLEDILRGQQRVPNGPVLAIPVLELALRQRGVSAVFDLGPLLWQAERYTDLARTFWLLSRDILQPPNQDWLQLEASLDNITDLAQRAALIYGLGNPWVWRQGRYGLLVAECYAHLDLCLERQELALQGTPRASYIAALRSWHGCALSEDIRGNLTRLVDLCSTFSLTCEGTTLSPEEAREIKTAEGLMDAAGRLLTQAREELPTRRTMTSVAEQLRSVAYCQQPVSLPSLMFGFWSQILADADNRWHQIQTAAAEQRPDSAGLLRLQDDLGKWQRRSFAPYHELQALITAFKEKSEQVRRLQQAVGEGALIKVFLRTTEISLGNKQTVAFEFQNNGNHMATDFTWSLGRFSGFDLVSSMSAPEPIELGPGEKRPLEIQVRATEPTLTLVFSYRYRDKAGRLQNGEDRAILRARSEAPGLRTKVNPFEVGRPVIGAAFFDRRTEISRILTRLTKGDTHPLVLRGPRRIGKSSLLREIAALLDQPSEAKEIGLSPELQSMLHNMHPIFASVQKMDRSLPRPLDGFLRGLLADICRKLAIDADPITLAFSQTSIHYGVPHAFMEQVEKVLVQRPGEHLVVLLDELDEVFREDAREPAKQLRNIIESETRISWITASTMLVKGSVGNYGSPWFNLLESIELRAMDWPAAFQLVRQLGGKAGFDWSEEAITAVLELSGRRPYLVQLLGARTTDDLNAQGRDRVESSDVAAAVGHLLDEISLTGSYLGFVWNEAQWLGKLMLWQLINASEPLRTVDLSRQIWLQVEAQGTAPNVDRFYAAFEERLAWLTDIADTLEIDQRNRIGFAIPLIKRLLGRVVEREQDFINRALSGLAAELREEL